MTPRGSASQAILHGPINSTRSYPFGALPRNDLVNVGYQLDEYLVEGSAQAYRLRSGLSAPASGLWATEPIGHEPFCTRIQVVRPCDPDAFNGVIVVNWQNVTAGFDSGIPIGREIYRGYVWVGVSAQACIVYGSEASPSLPEWAPDRYTALHHPGDQFSYSIFALAVKALLAQAPLALGGWHPDVLIATGPSQSATRLGSFVNGVHSHEPLFDGYLPLVHWGVCVPPDESRPRVTPGGHIFGDCQIRDDQGVPVFVVNSETEAPSVFPVRQPDTSTFRFWEVAGGAHGLGRSPEEMQDIWRRDGVRIDSRVIGDSASRNSLDWRYLHDAALRGLVRWIRDGAAPTRFPRIQFADDLLAGEETPSAGQRVASASDVSEPKVPAILRDADGNALGGLRPIELQVPTACYRGGNTSGDMIANLAGYERAFSAAEVRQRYQSEQRFLALWRSAADRLAATAVVLTEDLEALYERGIRRAAAFWDPP